MKNTLAKLLLTGLVASAMLASPVFAQAVEDPGHPRVNEVDQRIQNQENRTDAGIHQGTISPRQAKRDERRDAKVQRRAARDEAKHNGHLTKKEQRHLNKELNHNSKDIHKQRAQ
jgi:hypothetical protein